MAINLTDISYSAFDFLLTDCLSDSLTKVNSRVALALEVVAGLNWISSALKNLYYWNLHWLQVSGGSNLLT